MMLSDPSRRVCPRCDGGGMIGSMARRVGRGGVIRMAATLRKCTLCLGTRTVQQLDTEQRRLASCYRSEGWSDDAIARELHVAIEAVTADRIVAESE